MTLCDPVGSAGHREVTPEANTSADTASSISIDSSSAPASLAPCPRPQALPLLPNRSMYSSTAFCIAVVPASITVVRGCLPVCSCCTGT